MNSLGESRKRPPADLTVLAKRNNGKFPEDYVKKVLMRDVNLPAHGSAEMPVWGTANHILAPGSSCHKPLGRDRRRTGRTDCGVECVPQGHVAWVSS
jgi:hypothetical protein